MGNMFKCVLASGGTGNGIPLIVTCASAFVGLTITCTDGTTTLTDTCPSSSPYEVTFNLPNTGTWTVSGTISGVPYTESIVVQDLEITLNSSFTVTVDVYSAANDTVSYTGAIDGQTHTITTDSNGHATATITAQPNQPITFTSSVAKNPNDLTNDYSKAITLTENTTSIYVMPDNALYWYGYKNNLETISSANGWGVDGHSFSNPTYNTNSIRVTTQSGASYWSGVGTINSIDSFSKINAIAQGITANNNTYGCINSRQNKDVTNASSLFLENFTSTNVAFYTGTISSTNAYITSHCSNGRSYNLFALWYE